MEKREVPYATAGQFNAYTGQVIDMLSPNPKMIHPEDIYQGLGKICRFNGQISHFYSVAQHSVLVEHLAPHELKRTALLHDAAEAYIGDIIKPFKILLGDKLNIIEQNLEIAIFERFNEPIDNLKLIKQYDFEAYELERLAFQKGKISDWTTYWRQHLEYEVTVWPPDYAIKRFKIHFERRFRREVSNG